MSGEYYFANRYRIKSNRIGGFDYTSGWFFVTICTYDRQHYFGYVKNGEMILNEMGKIVYNEIKNIPDNREYVYVDKFVVMPNHVHIVLVLDDDAKIYDNNNDRDAINRVSTNPTKNNTHKLGGITGNHNPMLNKNSLGNIIRAYKSICTYTINKTNLGKFHRQSNYYDHIIRNEKSLNIIRTYIEDNPKKWNRDRNNSQSLYM